MSCIANITTVCYRVSVTFSYCFLCAHCQWFKWIAPRLEALETLHSVHSASQFQHQIQSVTGMQSHSITQ